MVCRTSTGGGAPVRFCSVHLLSDNGPDYEEYNRQQVVEVATLANKWVSGGEAVVIGGDFNAKPLDLRKYAKSDNTGEVKDFLEHFSDVDSVMMVDLVTGTPVRGRGTQNVCLF